MLVAIYMNGNILCGISDTKTENRGTPPGQIWLKPKVALTSGSVVTLCHYEPTHYYSYAFLSEDLYVLK